MICVSDQNLDYLLCDISLVALHKAILYTLHTVVVYTKHDKNGSEKMHYKCTVHSTATGQCSLPACLQYTYLKPVAYLHSPPPPFWPIRWMGCQAAHVCIAGNTLTLVSSWGGYCHNTFSPPLLSAWQTAQFATFRGHYAAIFYQIWLLIFWDCSPKFYLGQGFKQSWLLIRTERSQRILPSSWLDCLSLFYHSHEFICWMCWSLDRVAQLCLTMKWFKMPEVFWSLVLWNPILQWSWV